MNNALARIMIGRDFSAVMMIETGGQVSEPPQLI
jgi:hypothetical protein